MPADHHHPEGEPDHRHEGHGAHHHDQSGFEVDRSLGHYAGDFLRNWTGYDGSFAEKARLLLLNRWRSTGHLRPCCGHPGEPGC